MLREFFILVLCFFIVFSVQAKENINIFAYSRPTPESKIYDINNKQVSLQDYKGKFLIVIFWSKTCIPCIKELKKIREFEKKTSDTGISVILVSPHKDWISEEEHRFFVDKFGGGGLKLHTDKSSSLANDFGIFTSPHAVLINADSMEIGRIRGFCDWNDDDFIERIYKIKSTN